LGIFRFLRSLFQSPNEARIGGKQEDPKPRHPTPSHSSGGTVTYRQDLGTIEAGGGVSLHSSIVVRKFSEQEIQDNSQDNRWYFEPAFWRVAGEIEAPQDALKALLPDLLIAHTSGDPRREKETIMKHMPEGSWRWQYYENQKLEQEKDIYEERVNEINNTSLSELLNWLKVPELRALYKEHSSGKSGASGKKKAEIIKAICSVVQSDTAEHLAESLRNRFISEVAKPGSIDYREMCMLFARRVTMIAYAYRRRKQMLEISDRYPFWEFIASDDPDTPMKCKKLNGKVFRFDDPFWDTGYPPCERLDCGCRVEVKMK
jgi:SPP1 gp7 family putative phage head morphogenesis protein